MKKSDLVQIKDVLLDYASNQDQAEKIMGLSDIQLCETAFHNIETGYIPAEEFSDSMLETIDLFRE